MKQISFKLENIRKIEKFANVKVVSYFEIGKPSGCFKDEDGKEIKLQEGEVIFKDRAGNIFKKLK